MSLDLMTLVPFGSVFALVFSGYLAFSILKWDEGNEKMRQIAGWVREGAAAYLKRQYAGIALFFAVTFFILLALALKGYLVIFVPFAFLT